MEDTNLMIVETVAENRPLALRDVVEAGFRRRGTIHKVFWPVLMLAIAAGIFLPKYESEAKILVKHERVDPILTPEDKPTLLSTSVVSEEEINSEVQLLTSEDVLQEVVKNTGMDKRKGFRLPWSDDSQEMLTAKAVEKLRSKLIVEPVRKSNIIDVRFACRDPLMAKAVVDNLTRSLLQKHLEVNKPQGQYEFFDQEAAHYRDKLEGIENQLARLPKESNTVSPTEERDLTVQKVSDLKVALLQTLSSIEETNNRIASLQAQMKTTPERYTTQSRTADNPQLMQQLKSTLLELQLKRSDLLSKYAPTYRPVVEVEKQIAETQQAIAAAENAPLRDQTTDQNPLYSWLKGELARAKADLTALQARRESTIQGIAQFENSAEQLNRSGLQQADLLREAKANEENYLLYRRKREEARIMDALDQRRMVNVSLAQQPTLPVLPTRGLLTYILLGLLTGLAASAIAVFAVEVTDHTFHTPEDVQHALGIPVIASLPAPKEAA